MPVVLADASLGTRQKMLLHTFDAHMQGMMNRTGGVKFHTFATVVAAAACVCKLAGWGTGRLGTTIPELLPG